MKRKKVWRYWCDYCGKGGCCAGAMAKHEKHCIRNMTRACRMCKAQKTDVDANAVFLGAKGLDALIDHVDGCPACTLAAVADLNRFRQEDTPGQGFIEFDYKKACQEWWNEKNAMAMQEEQDYNAQMFAFYGELP